jgi:hypothetical protein
MTKIKKKCVKSLILLVLMMSLNVSTKTYASDPGLSKKLYYGEKAPFDGVLYSETAVREIDMQLVEKNFCERRLEESGCYEGESPGTKILFFLGGVASSFLVFSFLRR